MKTITQNSFANALTLLDCRNSGATLRSGWYSVDKCRSYSGRWHRIPRCGLRQAKIGAMVSAHGTKRACVELCCVFIFAALSVEGVGGK